MNRNLDVKK